MNRKNVFILVLILGLSSVDAGKFDGRKYFSNSRGVGIDGYDLVEYFQSSVATKGAPNFTIAYDGVKWSFKNQENLDLFIKSPEKYLPAYGGYCAWGMMKGYKAKVDPKAWKIVNKKLYLNYNSSIQKKWEKSILEFIEIADKNWENVQ